MPGKSWRWPSSSTWSSWSATRTATWATSAASSPRPAARSMTSTSTAAAPSFRRPLPSGLAQSWPGQLTYPFCCGFTWVAGQSVSLLCCCCCFFSLRLNMKIFYIHFVHASVRGFSSYMVCLAKTRSKAANSEAVLSYWRHSVFILCMNL